MKVALKWIEGKHTYEPCILPIGASLYEDDLNKEVECCWCGRKVKFGDCYTSRHIHNEIGLGYAECENCYNGGHNDK